MNTPILGGFREAVLYTRLSRRTLGRLLPEIEHIRVGARVLFTKNGLDDFLGRHRAPARPARKTASVEGIVRGLRKERAE
jgi:hypothetical protein